MRSKKVLIVREITMGLLQDLLIILSFGLTTPLLGLAVIASLVSKTLRWHHLICAFVVFDKQGQRRDLENLTGNCGEHSDNAHALFPARWFLVGYSVCFLGRRRGYRGVGVGASTDASAATNPGSAA